MEAVGILIFVIIKAIFGAITAAIASAKGRSTVGWFFGGFFLEIIGIILVAVLPNLKKKKAEDQHAESERRRLREQLRQERMKNEALRQHVTSRLDSHDRALGIDTRSQSPMLEPGEEGESRNIFEQPRQEVEQGEQGAPQWYYARDGKTKGPFSAEKMRRLREEGTINADCWVMPVGGRKWIPLTDVNSFYSG